MKTMMRIEMIQTNRLDERPGRRARSRPTRPLRSELTFYARRSGRRRTGLLSASAFDHRTFDLISSCSYRSIVSPNIFDLLVKREILPSVHPDLPARRRERRRAVFDDDRRA